MTKILDFLKTIWAFVVAAVLADYNSRKGQ